MKTIYTTWWWAAIVSVSLHMFLWVWVPQKTARAPVPHVQVAGADVVFYSASNLSMFEGEQETIKPLWSPALFSLPTSMGFSRRLWEERSVGKPPENPPVEFAHLLERTDVEALEGSITNFSDEVQILEPASLNAPLSSSRSVTRRAPMIDTNAYLFVQCEDGLFEKNSQKIRVRAGDSWSDDKDWETRAYVSADGRGAVQYVFLEKSSGSKMRDEKIIQWLKGFRIPARQREVAGWVTVRFVAPEKERVEKHD